MHIIHPSDEMNIQNDICEEWVYQTNELQIMRPFLNEFRPAKRDVRRAILAGKVLPLLKELPVIADFSRPEWSIYKRVSKRNYCSSKITIS